jgi:hypothetical protein
MKMAFYTKREFKPVNKKLTKEVDGKTVVEVTVVYKEGREGTGITLPFPCGFCADPKTGLATWAGRTRKERNRHANYCPDKPKD